MEQRFGLTFMIYDRNYVTAKRQERGYSINPWNTHNRFIISQALVRNEAYAAPLRDWLGDFRGGSLLILDEAHNAAPASGSRYAIDSRLTRAIRDLAPRFEHKLFLSATPHNGHSNSFSALLEILDPQKFCRGVPVHHASRDAVMVRRLGRMLEGGIHHERTDDLTAAIGTVGEERRDTARERVIHEELEEVRERKAKLTGQVERLEGLLKLSKDWIGLDDRHFRDALSASLEILGADAIRPLDAAEATRDPATARWEIPALDERKGADPTWAVTLDSLRAPRQKGQAPWEWRREAPIRPVVFRDPGTLDGEVVHLHLEHRLVQRLLGRFMAQGFLHDELTRACVVRTDDPLPRVVAMGRLSLYGEGASRLHDEILSVAAEWHDPAQRGRAKLRPLGEGAKVEVLRLLNEALAHPRLREVPEGLQRRLRATAVQDVSELHPHLERRAGALAERAARDLVRRGQQEAKEMRRILERQRARIDKHRHETEDKVRQQVLDFGKDEMRQLHANMRHWGVRLDSLKREIEQEPARIRAGYEVRARRVEPVGLVYLWPVSS